MIISHSDLKVAEIKTVLLFIVKKSSDVKFAVFFKFNAM